MRYLGGKSRIARQLVEAMGADVAGRDVWEPFCGGLSMTRALEQVGARVRPSDANAALIALYRAVAAGWVPPETVSEAERDAALDLPDSDPMKAFCRIGCGFAGNWASGYARDGARNFAQEAKRALSRDCPGRTFFCVDFLAVEPRPINATIYCDPPYRGTTGYRTGAFDHALFDSRVRAWAQWQPVYVSEYDFPAGEVMWQAPVRVQSSKSQAGNAIEKLFRVKA
jgi:hypothetical protein